MHMLVPAELAIVVAQISRYVPLFEVMMPRTCTSRPRALLTGRRDSSRHCHSDAISGGDSAHTQEPRSYMI